MSSQSKKQIADGKLFSIMKVNRLSSDVSIKGSITSSDCTFIDGDVEGDITLSQKLIVGENAQIKGNIEAEYLVVMGKVTGNIRVKEMTTFESKSSFCGIIFTKRIEIQEGASFNAQCNLSDSETSSSLNSSFMNDRIEPKSSKTIQLNPTFINAEAFFS